MKRPAVLFLILSLLTLIFCAFMNRSLPLGANSVPPLGKFFSPFTGFWQNSNSKKELHPKNFHFDHLKSSVRVVYDQRLVPHIFAEHIEDAYFIQGFLHAKYRLFQMDISTKSAAGRLSEIAGPVALQADQQSRHLGMTFAAENALEGWKKFDSYYRLLQHYTDGVNAYISSLKPSDYPIEFKLLNYRPEPWSDLKTALFIKNMARTLCSRNHDLEASNMLNHFGSAVFEDLYPEYNPKQSPVIPDNPSREDHFETLFPIIGNLDHTQLDETTPDFNKIPEGIGSNNWAISGESTENGYALLCNDPHLNLTLPSTWYELQIHTPQMNVYGVSLPGVPGIIIGFNEKIAWGMTNVGHDVLDWYRIKWIDDTKMSYELDGKVMEVEERTEKYIVKGGKDIIEKIKYTVFGPVVPQSGERDQSQGLAIRWLAHDMPVGPELGVFTELNKASNFEEFTAALYNYRVPAQNFAFASIDGSVGLRVNGQFPIKDSQNGRFIKDGSSSDEFWDEYIPMDEVPSVYKPVRGFVSSANQHSTSPKYPYYYNGDFEDYRSRAINEILESPTKFSVEDMMKMQHNVLSVKARDVLPMLLSMINPKELSQPASDILGTLQGWDYNYNAGSEAASYFEILFSKFYQLSFDEINELQDTMKVLWPESWRLIDMLENEPEHIFFDIKASTAIEDASEIVKLSFQQLIDEVKELKGEGKSLKWGEFRPKSINHLLRIPAFSELNLSISGHGDVINAVSGSHGPSWRMIVNLNPEEIEAFGVYPGGQSGNPGSRFYKTGIQPWINGEYFKLTFMKSSDEDENSLFVENYSKK